MTKTPPKTVADFKAKHNPATIIKRLESDLAEVSAQLGVENAIKELLGTTVLELNSMRPPKWLEAAKHKASSPGVPTIFLSDLHWGEVVNPREIGGVNEYNLEIARKRLKYTVNTAVYLCSILSPKMDYPGIVCPLGGDMISGDIHEELAATNALPTIPTVLELWEQLASAIRMLADKFGHVFCPCVSGNHGRNTKKTWAKNRNRTSFDWMLYQMLAKEFAGDSRVSFYVPDGSDALYKIYNTRYLLTHGDQFKAGDSIIGPIGPLMRGNQKKTARNQQVGQGYDVMLAGHWHQYIHTERMIINGSLKGYDEYAASWNFAFEPPRQALWVTHPRYGINWRMPVLSEPPAELPAQPWVSVHDRV